MKRILVVIILAMAGSLVSGCCAPRHGTSSWEYRCELVVFDVDSRPRELSWQNEVNAQLKRFIQSKADEGWVLADVVNLDQRDVTVVLKRRK